MSQNPEENHKPLLLAKILRQLLLTEQFETLADLKDALKARTSRLHIRYEGADVDRALELVGSNRPLADAPRVQKEHEPQTPVSDEMSKADARRIYYGLMAKCGPTPEARAAVSSTPRPEHFPDLTRVS